METTRTCKTCGKQFTKKSCTSKKEWKERYKCCSKKCAAKYKYKRGLKIWNKGLSKETDERVRAYGESQKGVQKPYKKGQKSGFYRKKHTQESKELMSQGKKGEKHWNWQGGITDATHRLRQQIKNKAWRKKVLERDNYTCQQCGENKKEKLETHHIKDFKKYPKLRYKLENGITLCNSCHCKITLHNKIL